MTMRETKRRRSRPKTGTTQPTATQTMILPMVDKSVVQAVVMKEGEIMATSTTGEGGGGGNFGKQPISEFGRSFSIPVR